MPGIGYANSCLGSDYQTGLVSARRAVEAVEALQGRCGSVVISSVLDISENQIKLYFQLEGMCWKKASRWRHIVPPSAYEAAREASKRRWITDLAPCYFYPRRRNRAGL